MLDSPTHLSRASLLVRTPQVDVARFGRGKRSSALGAVLGHDPFTLVARSPFDDGTKNFGNHVTRFAQNHGVTDHDALCGDDIFVVECRLANHGTRNANRFHHRIRRCAASSTNSHHDVEQFCVDLFGRVLVCNRPSRCPRSGAEQRVNLKRINFDDGSINLMLERVAFRVVALNKLKHRVVRVNHCPVR